MKDGEIFGHNTIRTVAALVLSAGLLHGQNAGTARKQILPIDDLPGWSAWTAPVGSVAVEVRWRLFNANVKPGCGVEWRSKDPKAAYTIDAVIGYHGNTSRAQLTGEQELMGAPTAGVLAGQDAADRDIPLHFALFGDGKTVSYYDLHRPQGCNKMEIRVLKIEQGAR
jgi:hypothetical protein